MALNHNILDAFSVYIGELGERSIEDIIELTAKECRCSITEVIDTLEEMKRAYDARHVSRH